jgi:general secretion pathway protein G
VKKRKGFTMVELMVVIIIMAILGLAIMPALMGSSEKAKYSRAWSDLDAIANAFTAYYGKEGNLPTLNNTADLDENIYTEPERELLQSFLGTQLEDLYDPWNQRYQIDSDWDADKGTGHIIVYVKGTGSATFSSTTLSGVKLDPYNGDEPMARLVINVM